MIILSVICLLGLVSCSNSMTEASDIQVSASMNVNTDENDMSDTRNEATKKQLPAADVNTN